MGDRLPLAGFYFGDRRLTLVPVEHLSAGGTSAAFAAALTVERGWEAPRIALLNEGFARYWQRSAELARRLPDWPTPRCRHIAVLDQPFDVHPYVSLLNTSAYIKHPGPATMAAPPLERRTTGIRRSRQAPRFTS